VHLQPVYVQHLSGWGIRFRDSFVYPALTDEVQYPADQNHREQEKTASGMAATAAPAPNGLF
jgi:hypothetical protein